LPVPAFDRQQAWPFPPQGTQLPLFWLHEAYGAVQVAAAPVPQHFWPMPPHPALPPHSPALHIPPPDAAEQAVLAATHFAVLSQQPPAPQPLPSQQGWPVPPQAWQVLPAAPPPPQVNPETVQKSAGFVRSPPPAGLPGQQALPEAPQPAPPLRHSLVAPPTVPQAPRVLPPPQVVPVATQVVPLQQSVDPVPQPPPPQQGWPVAPQAAVAPREHTMPLMAGTASPSAKQLPPEQQPPPAQVLPVQQIWPGSPQA
jgi:hypothetical protein